MAWEHTRPENNTCFSHWMKKASTRSENKRRPPSIPSRTGTSYSSCTYTDQKQALRKYVTPPGTIRHGCADTSAQDAMRRREKARGAKAGRRRMVAEKEATKEDTAADASECLTLETHCCSFVRVPVYLVSA